MNDPKKGLSHPEIRLAYVRMFIWPAFGLIFLFLFYQPIKAILSNDIELEMFGVRFAGSKQDVMEGLLEKSKSLEELVGEVIEDLENANKLNTLLLAQNDSLSLLLDDSRGELAQDDPSEMQAMQSQNEQLHLQSEQLTIRSEDVVQRTRRAFSKGNFEKAEGLEKKAFNYLLNKNYAGALESFRLAEKANPGYHNAYEISNLIDKNFKELTNKDPEVASKARTTILNLILKKFSWGVDDKILHSIEEELRR